MRCALACPSFSRRITAGMPTPLARRSMLLQELQAAGGDKHPNPDHHHQQRSQGVPRGIQPGIRQAGGGQAAVRARLRLTGPACLPTAHMVRLCKAASGWRPDSLQQNFNPPAGPIGLVLDAAFIANVRPLYDAAARGNPYDQARPDIAAKASALALLPAAAAAASTALPTAWSPALLRLAPAVCAAKPSGFVRDALRQHNVLGRDR